MMISVHSWILLILFICFYLLWKRRKFYLLMTKFPGPTGYPIIGMAHKFMQKDEVLKVFDENIKKYGTVLFSWLGTIPFLVVSEPQIIQDILTSPDCVNKGMIYASIDDGTGPGLFSLKDPEWSVHRKLINPAFGHKVLLSFIPIFNEEVGDLMKQLDMLLGKGPTDLIPLLQKFTLGIATRTTMGGNVKQEEKYQNNTVLQSFKCVQDTMTDMCFSPWLTNRTLRRLLCKDAKYFKAKQEINTFIRKLVDKKIKELEKTTICIKDINIFLNLAVNLLKKGTFSLETVENESKVMVFGAFETTANTVAYVLMLLSIFPEYQEKAFDEMKTLFPEVGNFEVTYADTQQMIYLDMVINETMRFMAPVPLVSRQTTKDVKLSNGVIIPEGTQIAINIFYLHRNEALWGPKAKSFNPEHFLPVNMEDKHPYAFIPFTKGIRNCIGWRYALLSAKVTLAKLLRNYRFSTDFNFKNLEFVEDITIKLKTIPLLQLHSRDENVCTVKNV